MWACRLITRYGPVLGTQNLRVRGRRTITRMPGRRGARLLGGGGAGAEAEAR